MTSMPCLLTPCLWHRRLLSTSRTSKLIEGLSLERRSLDASSALQRHPASDLPRTAEPCARRRPSGGPLSGAAPTHPAARALLARHTSRVTALEALQVASLHCSATRGPTHGVPARAGACGPLRRAQQGGRGQPAARPAGAARARGGGGGPRRGAGGRAGAQPGGGGAAGRRAWRAGQHEGRHGAHAGARAPAWSRARHARAVPCLALVQRRAPAARASASSRCSAPSSPPACVQQMHKHSFSLPPCLSLVFTASGRAPRPPAAPAGCRGSAAPCGAAQEQLAAGAPKKAAGPAAAQQLAMAGKCAGPLRGWGGAGLLCCHAQAANGPTARVQDRPHTLTPLAAACEPASAAQAGAGRDARGGGRAGRRRRAGGPHAVAQEPGAGRPMGAHQGRAAQHVQPRARRRGLLARLPRGRRHARAAGRHAVAHPGPPWCAAARGHVPRAAWAPSSGTVTHAGA